MRGKDMSKQLKNTMAAVMAGAMVFTMCSPASAQAAGGGDEIPQLLAEFDFNGSISDGEIDGGAAVANVYGTAVKLEERADGDKALRFNGEKGNYLSLTKDDGTSLLTGKTEITISFDTKRVSEGTSWIFYAAPNDNAPIYNSEKYFACYSKEDPGIRVERYLNSGGRSEAIVGAADAKWVHVDVVVTEKATGLLIDGELMDIEPSDHTIADILGDNSIFYLGKANWGGGEYADCWIDNFRIYDGRLPEAVNKMLWEGVSLPTDPIKDDLDLPETNTLGDAVTWTSGNTNIIADDGTLEDLPAANTEVTMTAKIGDQTKTFTVTAAGANGLLQEAYDG